MDFHQKLNRIETGFNVAGAIPGVAILSGAARTLLATAQIVAGVVLLEIGAVGRTISLVERSERGKTILRLGCVHFLQGIANAARGVGESALSYTGVGPLALLGAQAYLSERQFAPVYPY